jgi:hypothetical protein
MVGYQVTGETASGVGGVEEGIREVRRRARDPSVMKRHGTSSSCGSGPQNSRLSEPVTSDD